MNKPTNFVCFCFTLNKQSQLIIEMEDGREAGSEPSSITMLWCAETKSFRSNFF